jgi:prepilin-type N-terminal cleavage/methylation domain-containing protein
MLNLPARFTARAPASARGFSLVELMVAMVAGLIVVGAVGAFALSSLRANSEFIRATRLTQELRTSLGFVTDELRRAGYDERAMDFVFRPTTFTGVSPFTTINIVGPNSVDGCVVYAYDRLPGTAGSLELANGEMRAVRRVQRNVNGQSVGVLEFAESSVGVSPACNGATPDYSTYPVSCNGASGWCALSDPRILDVTALTLSDAGIVNLTPGGLSLPIQIRRIDVDLRGRLINATDITRGVHADVRVRADCVRANPGLNCTAAPAGT